MNRRKFLQYVTMAASSIAINPIRALEVKEIGQLNAAKMVAMENAVGTLSEWMEQEILNHIFGGEMMSRQAYETGLSWYNEGGRLE